MRVCISYTHPYPIKFLSHTLPFRICKLCFEANMQVTSTLWHVTKSQKISVPIQAQMDQVKPKNRSKPSWGRPCLNFRTRGDQDKPTPGSWRRLAARAGRTTYLVGRPGLWAPPPQPRHVALPCWLTTSVWGATAGGSLL